MTKRRRNSPRDYPRTARLNELIREILASELDRIDDEDLGWVSISGVDVDNELTKAKVFVSALHADAASAAVDILQNYRGRFRKVIGQQAQLRKVPDIVFTVDPAISSGGRVEQILADLRKAGDLEDRD